MAITPEPLGYDALVKAALDTRNGAATSLVYATLALAYQQRTANIIAAMPKSALSGVPAELQERLGVS